MKPIVTEIASGVCCCAIAAERFKTSRMVLQMALPLALGQGRQTAAGALLPFLLHRSCAAYPTPRALESKLADLYGAKLSANVQKLGEAQLLSITLTAIDDRFALGGEKVAEDCADLLLDLLFAPLLEGGLFRKSSLELEQRLLIERLESEEGEKRKHASNRCEALMCSQEAYGLNPLGEREAIAALTPEDITQAWRDLLETAPMQLTMVSNAGCEGVCEALKKRFGGQPRRPVMPVTEFIAQAGEEKSVREEQPVEQANLVIGLRAGVHEADEKQYALRVMNSLFGGGVHSKLFLNVREKMSLCYMVYSGFHRFKGIVSVHAGIDNEKFDQARDAILDMLRQLQDGEFTDEDLAMAQRSLCDSYTTAEDLPESLAGWYSPALVSGQFGTPEEACARVNAVTRAEVIAAAQGVTLDTVYLLAAKKEGANE